MSVVAKRLFCLFGTLATAALVHLATAAPHPVQTTVLGPFTGDDAKLHPDNLQPHHIAYYGTDLGFSYQHNGKIEFLFGDTAANERGDPIQASTGSAYDDGFGSINLTEWPNAARIAPGRLPPIRLGQNPGTSEMAAINPGMPMESFKTPLGGFSNGVREFALFYSSKPRACRVDADCGGGFRCDIGLGFVGEPYDQPKGLTLACNDRAPGCTADTMRGDDGKPVAGSGMCIDPTSTIWAATDVGRVSAVAVTQLVGIRDTVDPRLYGSTQRWLTNKFANVTVRTAQDFVPQRGAGRAHQDYRSAGAQGPNRRVFLWGRPGFIGVLARGRTLGVYFAYVDMPAGPDFTWRIHYYAGTDAKGTPRFSVNEQDAVPADLDSTRRGIQSAEVHDIVNQMSVAWVEALGKWLMFYGGGMGRLPTPPALPDCGLLEVFARAECREVVTGNGAIRMRTADDPWGPWSPPRDVIVGGDPDAAPPQHLYGVGGVLRHPACIETGCASGTDSPQLHKDEYGFLYGANIIAEWLKPAGDGVDVIWNASTWDPYRVVLLRTRISR